MLAIEQHCKNVY